MGEIKEVHTYILQKIEDDKTFAVYKSVNSKRLFIKEFPCGNPDMKLWTTRQKGRAETLCKKYKNKGFTVYEIPQETTLSKKFEARLNQAEKTIHSDEFVKSKREYWGRSSGFSKEEVLLTQKKLEEIIDSIAKEHDDAIIDGVFNNRQFIKVKYGKLFHKVKYKLDKQKFTRWVFYMRMLEDLLEEKGYKDGRKNSN